MRISRIFRAVGWRSALGELVLIVAGVSIALAGTAWFEEWQERADEVEVLLQLAEALEDDLARLTSAHNRQRRRLDDVVGLLAHLEGGRSDGENVGFGSVTGWVGVGTNSAPYEALKSRGLSLISSDSLRLGLVEYYETRFPGLASGNENDRVFSTEMVLPYYLSNFRRSTRTTWVPLDPAAVRDDPYYWNLAMTKLMRLEIRILPSLERVLTLGRELLRTIDRQLEDSDDRSAGAA